MPVLTVLLQRIVIREISVLWSLVVTDVEESAVAEAAGQGVEKNDCGCHCHLAAVEQACEGVENHRLRVKVPRQ